MSKLSDARKKIQSLNLTPKTEQAFEVILEVLFPNEKAEELADKEKAIKEEEERRKKLAEEKAKSEAAPVEKER